MKTIRYQVRSLTYPRFLAQNIDFYTMLGAKRQRWPEKGIKPKVLDCVRLENDNGVKTEGTAKVLAWVTEQPYTGHKSSIHRVLCLCPGCGRVLGLGRLAQHACDGSNEKVIAAGIESGALAQEVGDTNMTVWMARRMA